MKLICFCVLHIKLARYPAKQQKLREEILRSLGETEVFEIASGLDYLSACIHGSVMVFFAFFYVAIFLLFFFVLQKLYVSFRSFFL